MSLSSPSSIDRDLTMRPANLSKQDPRTPKIHTGLEGSNGNYRKPQQFGFEARHDELRSRLGPLFDKLKNPQDEEGELFSN